jgi:hypothetical protein
VAGVNARWIVAVCLPVAACASGAPPSGVPNLFDAQRRIADYVDSGRYASDCAAAAARASAWLDHRAQRVKKPAAVFDIDETSLSNWPAYRANGWVDFKAPERRRLTEQGYTILISIGDQQSDLDGGFAERTFKLPNPVYFLP